MAFSYNDYNESDEVKRRKAEADAYAKYNESQSVADARTALAKQEQNKVADWTGGTYGDSLKQAIDRINNRQKFTYDLNADMLYQQYKDQYINGGRLAMMDTLGQASALTGGYGNSYAATAGNQAYQQYLTKLNDVVPQLYQMAYQQYQDEGDNMYRNAGLYQDMYNTEYGQYRDQVSDWQNEINRLQDRYYNESNMDYNRYTDQRDYYRNAYDTERNYDYGLYSDAYDRAFSNYQQQVAESQYAQDLALQQAKLNETIRANRASEAAKAAELAQQKANQDSQTATKGQIVNYVASQVKKGVNNTSIRNSLLNNGVSKDEIDEAMRYVFKDSQVK